MKHKCKNPKHCPICNKKIRIEIIKFYNNNPHIVATTNQIAEKFNISLRLSQKILSQLEKRNILRRLYQYNKRLTVGKGVDTFYTKNLDYAQLKFNHG